MNAESNALKKKEFEKIYSRFFSFFFQIAAHFLHHEEDAKEVVQEAFIKLWEKDIYQKSEQEIKNYLFIIIKNRCLNLLRDRRKSLQHIAGHGYLAVSVSYKILEATGEDILLSAELSQKIQLAISGLTPQCRDVFTLSRIEGLSNKEIAEKLEISVKAVEANMTRALKKMREELSPYLSEKHETAMNLPIFTFLLSFL